MRGFLSLLLPALKPSLPWLALAILLGAAAAAANLALLSLSGWFITAMAAAGLAGVSMNYFTPGAIIRGLSIARTAGRYGERVVGHDATLRVVALLRPWLFARMLRLAPGGLQEFKSGDLLTQFKSDLDRVELAFLRIIAPTSVAALVLLPTALILLFLDRPAGLAAVLLIALATVAVPLGVLRASAPLSAGIARESGIFNARLVDHVEGLADLAIFDPSGRHAASTVRQGDALLAAERHLALIGAAGGAAVNAFAQVAFAIGLVLALAAFADGRLDAPEVPMLGLLALAAFEIAGPLVPAMQAAPAVAVSIGRLRSLIARAPADPAPREPRPVPADLTVVFENVGYRPPGASAWTFRGLSFEVAEGARFGISGASGAGKSTAINLLMRFALPDEGRITVGGEALAALDGDAWRKNVALLAQDAAVFAGTLRENLQVADPRARDGQILEALRLAGADDILARVPEGLDEWIGPHGLTLSGGEARRVALARALLKPARILVLDEPTEGLDPDMALSVVSGILAARPEQTIIIATHDARLLRLCDHVADISASRPQQAFHDRF